MPIKEFVSVDLHIRADIMIEPEPVPVVLGCDAIYAHQTKFISAGVCLSCSAVHLIVYDWRWYYACYMCNARVRRLNDPAHDMVVSTFLLGGVDAVRELLAEVRSELRL